MRRKSYHVDAGVLRLRTERLVLEGVCHLAITLTSNSPDIIPQKNVELGSSLLPFFVTTRAFEVVYEGALW